MTKSNPAVYENTYAACVALADASVAVSDCRHDAYARGPAGIESYQSALLDAAITTQKANTRRIMQ